MVLKIETGKLSAKGVVAIPVKVRNLLGVEKGDKLEFVQEGEQVIVRGIKRKSILDALQKRISGCACWLAVKTSTLRSIPIGS